MGRGADRAGDPDDQRDACVGVPRCLDHAPAASLDPAILRSNLDALLAVDPALAARVSAARIPDAWCCATALDGSTTFRTGPASASGWFDGTAAPATRAAGLLRDFRAGDRCIALASIGTGQEIRLLLEQLTPQLALFVFEPDITAIRAVMERSDLSAAIRHGQLRLLPDAAPDAALRDHLAAHPGVRSPQVLLAVPTVEPQRVEATRAAIETVGREIEARRAARIAEIAEQLGTTAGTRNTPDRIALLSLAPLPDAHAACREFARAGTPALVVDRPDLAHPLKAAEFVHAERPDVLVWTGTAAPPVRGDRIISACWHTSAARLPESLSAETIHLAASPRLLEELKEINPTARVLPFFWPAPAVDSSNQQPDRAIYVVGDVPDDSAEACGIFQATHRTLWNEMRRLARERWAEAAVHHPGHLLTTTERRTGLKISDPAIRRQFLRMIRHVLIPTCGLGKIRQSVERTGTRLKLVGRGWRRQGVEDESVAADDLSLLGPSALNTRPAAAVFSLVGDAFSPALLTALSAGWPVILHAPEGVRGLAGVGNEHVLSFGDEAGLRRCLRSLENGQTRRRAEMAREFVQTTHSAGRRLADLRKLLSG